LIAGGNGAGGNANQLDTNRGIFVDNNGLYIADSSNNRIQLWRLDGSTTGSTVASGNNLNGVWDVVTVGQTV